MRAEPPRGIRWATCSRSTWCPALDFCAALREPLQWGSRVVWGLGFLGCVGQARLTLSNGCLSIGFIRSIVQRTQFDHVRDLGGGSSWIRG